jgi:hypothetical protein
MKKIILFAVTFLFYINIFPQTVPVPRDSVFRTQSLDGTNRLWFFLGKKNAGGALFWDTSDNKFRSYFYNSAVDSFVVKNFFDTATSYTITNEWKWLLDNHETVNRAIYVENKRDSVGSVSDTMYGIQSIIKTPNPGSGYGYAIYAKADKQGGIWDAYAGYFDGDTYYKGNLKADTLKLTPSYIKFAPSSGYSFLHSSVEQIGTRSIYNSFISGWSGSGYRLDYGIKNANKSELEIDNLTVRGRLSVYELLLRQIRATNGNLFITSSAKVDSVYGSGGTYYLRFDDPSGSNVCPFAVNDLLRAQRYSPNKTLIRLCEIQVINVSGRVIQYVYNTGSDSVQLGDDFVRIGNTTDVSRSSSIYLASDDTYSPYIDLIDSVQSFSDWGTSSKIKVRIGKLDGIVDPDFGGALSGYGEYMQNVFLKGKIKINSNSDIIGLTIPSANYTYGDTFPTSSETGDWFYYITTATWFRYNGTGWSKMSPSQTYIDGTGLYTGTIIANKVLSGSFTGQTFTGGTFMGNTFTGGTFQTDTTGQRVVIDNSNSIKFYAPDSSLVSSIIAYSDTTYVHNFLNISGNVNFSSTVNSVKYEIGVSSATKFWDGVMELTRIGLNFNKSEAYPVSSLYTATRLDTGGLHFFNGTSLSKFLYADLDTLKTGKTFDASKYKIAGSVGTAGQVLRSNGTTGFVASIINASDLPTAIDATKIADGSITNTEFQYLDGLGGRIIDLLANKVDTGSSYSNPSWLTSLAFSKISGFVTSGGSSGYYVATSSGGSPTTQLAYYVVDGRKFLYVP